MRRPPAWRLRAWRQWVGRHAACLLLASTSAPGQQALLPPAERLQPVPARDVHLADGSFWGPRLATNLLVSLRHGAEQLEQHGQFGNFRLAAATLGHPLPGGVAPPAEYAGVHFYDSDAYKWLEACCLALEQPPPGGVDAAAAAAARADLRVRVDRFVEEIAAAQREDGYLQTQYVVQGLEPWVNLHDDHELYCAGHLIQAAIAHQRATGSARLMDVALRFADLIDVTFGPDASAGERPGCPGHPEIETALVQLSDHTGDRRWLELAGYFLEARGHGLLGGDEQLQDHAPIREQRTASGHAVRQLYLCSGVLGVGARTGDEGLVEANLALWDDIAGSKLYVTGGLGARPDGEAFGAPFELPHERAYSETCASIAWMRWNHELLSATGEARFAAALETTLYNAFLAAVGQDGKCWYYVNPLESRGGHLRQPWFWCACCPPNVMRTFAGLPGWVASTSQDTLWIHLYDDCVIDATLGDGRRVRVQVETDWPWGGDVRLRLLEAEGGSLDVALRLPPDPAGDASAGAARGGTIRGYRIVTLGAPPGAGSYDTEAHDTAPLGAAPPGAEAQLHFDTRPRLLLADSRIADARGQLALRAGPIVYAFEGRDQPGELSAAAIEPDSEATPCQLADLDGVPALRLRGVESVSPATRALYEPGFRATRALQLIAIPYHAWSQRGDASMRVWMPAVQRVPTFADDVAFLESHADAVVLQAEGAGPVVVSPRLSGRVMTSAFAGSEPGFGLVHREHILERPIGAPFANYGGEDRLWLAPEGGPHGLFFAPGAEQVGEHWAVPRGLDGPPREVASAGASRIDFATWNAGAVSLRNASGALVTLAVDRSVQALSRDEIAGWLGVPLDEALRVVGFRSTNRLSWAPASDELPAGAAGVSDALVGLWVLGQFTPSDETRVLFPFRGDAAGLGASPLDAAAAAIKRDYFGLVPDERLLLELPGGSKASGLARFTADGRLRSKIGLSRAGATGWIGAWDETRGVLTLVQHSLPPLGAPVPDCDWKLPNPLAAQGDVATSYNHGDEPRFFELETLSAALPHEPRAQVEHEHTTLHLGGERAALAELARRVLHAEL